MLKHTLNDQWALAGRAEYFFDDKGVLIATGTPNNFQVFGGSLNVDYAASPNLLWRIEGRMFSSRDMIYPAQDGLKKNDGFVTLSAAISF
jgi:hypothetical protein